MDKGWSGVLFACPQVVSDTPLSSLSQFLLHEICCKLGAMTFYGQSGKILEN